jgi:hypothetical protein
MSTKTPKPFEGKPSKGPQNPIKPLKVTGNESGGIGPHDFDVTAI